MFIITKEGQTTNMIILITYKDKKTDELVVDYGYNTDLDCVVPLPQQLLKTIPHYYDSVSGELILNEK
jgi:hypothetical protein